MQGSVISVAGACLVSAGIRTGITRLVNAHQILQPRRSVMDTVATAELASVDMVAPTQARRTARRMVQSGAVATVTGKCVIEITDNNGAGPAVHGDFATRLAILRVQKTISSSLVHEQKNCCGV